MSISTSARHRKRTQSYRQREEVVPDSAYDPVVKNLNKKKVIQSLKDGDGFDLKEGGKDFLIDQGTDIAVDVVGGEDTATGGALGGGMSAFLATGHPYIAIGAAVLGGLAGMGAAKDKRKKHAAKWKAKEKEALAEGGERKLAAMQKMKGALRSSLNRPSRVRAMSRME